MYVFFPCVTVGDVTLQHRKEANRTGKQRTAQESAL